MKKVDIVLVGFGNVGREFVRLVIEKQEVIRQRHGLDLRFRTIFRTTGSLMVKSQSPIEGILAGTIPPGREAALWNPAVRLPQVLAPGARGVLVECASSDIRTGEPGLEIIRTALSRGWHAVTADKGPLVAGLGELRKTAARKGLTLGSSGAAGAALPALDVGLRSLAGTEITAVEGILNGTTNYILTRMGQGASFDQALRAAQARGIAEPDPSYDVQGLDTAVKLLLLANAAMGLCLGLGDIDIEPVTRVSRRRIETARRRGQKIKLLGKIQRGPRGVRAEAKLRALGPSHPLFGVDGTDKGVTFTTDTMGAVTVTGGKSDPRGAAAALLKDIINIYVR
jgi:homoserine dehydrogenase